MMLLHGEQYLELKGPIPLNGTFHSVPRVVSVSDKGGKGVVVTVGVVTNDESGKELFYNEFSNFIRGIRLTTTAPPSTSRSSTTSISTVPKRQPDVVVKEKTMEEQAVLYRLSGDTNPLHVDPEMSAMGGFKVPILHGLCTFGYAARHVFQSFGRMNPSGISAIKVLFHSHPTHFRLSTLFQLICEP